MNCVAAPYPVREVSMAPLFRMHPRSPPRHLVAQVVQILRGGGIIIYPTDSCYALGWRIGDKGAQARIRLLRGVDPKHEFTLVCRNLSEIALYAKVDNSAYRLIKSLTPGAYTFILKATYEVPRRLRAPRRKTIGLRVPDNPVALAILAALGEPILSSTLWLPGDDRPLTDADAMRERLGRQVDLIIDGGNCGYEPTTVVDLVDGTPLVVRRGKGDVSVFQQ